MGPRNFAGTTQRSYIHYVAEFAKYFNRSSGSWIWKLRLRRTVPLLWRASLAAGGSTFEKAYWYTLW